MKLHPIQRYERAWLMEFIALRILLVAFLLLAPFGSALHSAGVVIIDPMVTMILLAVAVFLPAFVVMGTLTLRSSKEIDIATNDMDQIEWSLCLDCNHVLVGLGSSGACPECGTPFNQDQIQEIWKERLSSRPDKWKTWSRILDACVLVALVGSWYWGP